MIRLIFTTMIFIFALMLSACFDESETVVPHNNPSRVFFQQNCAVCHGMKGEGKQIGEKTAPDLRSQKIRNESDEKLFQQISNGGGGMPAFKYQIDEEKIREMVRFIREEIQGKK